MYVQPRASRDRFAGEYGNAMRLAVTAPPVDGKANAAVISFLASFFKLKKKNIEIRHGLQSRSKSILVDGLSEEIIRAKIEAVSG